MPNRADVWPMIEQLAHALDGSREISERALDNLEGELKGMPRPVRDDLRRNMILVVAGLSRLEVRFMDSDGPLDTSI